MKRISLCSILLAICFLVSCSFFSKHTVTNKKEMRTEIFLEKPDYLICITNGTEKQLDSNSIETVYNAFMSLIDTLQQTGTLKTGFQSKKVKEWKKEYTCFEFRYMQRRNYIGALDDGEFFSWGELRFDAFLFIYYSGGLIAVPYIGNSYVGINNLYLFLEFPEEEMNKFMNVL